MQEIWITQCVAQALLEKVTINPTREPAEDDPQTSEQLYQINSHMLKIFGPTTEQDRFPHSQSLPSGSFHKKIFINQRADRMKTTITEN